jgi:hypothetical protein
MYCGIPTIVLPVTTDRHRGGEQRDNADIARRADNIIAVFDWRCEQQLSAAVDAALRLATRTRRTTGLRGNEDVARFVVALPDMIDGSRAVSSGRLFERN